MERKGREEIIIDTDFLSSFFKIGKIDLIFKAFYIKEIFICQAVMKELQEARFYEDLLNFIRKNENKITIKSQLTKETKEDFGEGEIESIYLAEQTNSLLLMDDRAAGRFARTKGIAVLNIPEFLLYCKEKSVISLDEIKMIIQDLKEKDYYRFTEEVEDELLKE